MSYGEPRCRCGAPRGYTHICPPIGVYPRWWFTLPAQPAQPARCPVCDGRGSVPAGFYSNGVATSTANEKCRTCEGLGAINAMLLPTPSPPPSRPGEEPQPR